MIPTRAYGATPLRVSALGLGAAQLGDRGVDEDEAARLLAAARGRRRDADRHRAQLRIVRATHRPPSRRAARALRAVHQARLRRCPASPDWTGPCITAGVDQALRVLRTDRIDIATCTPARGRRWRGARSWTRWNAAQGGGQAARDRLFGRERGPATTRSAWVASTASWPRSICSTSACSQVLPRIAGQGFIAKRPVGQPPVAVRPSSPPATIASHTGSAWRAMGLDSDGMDVGRTGDPLRAVGSGRVQRDHRHRSPGAPAAEPRLGGEGSVAAGNRGGLDAPVRRLRPGLARPGLAVPRRKKRCPVLRGKSVRSCASIGTALRLGER